MTTPTPVILPSLLTDLVKSGARQALTAGAAALVAHGYALSDSQTQTLVEQGVGVAVIVASVAWSFLSSKLNQKRLAVAISPGVVDAQNPPAGSGPVADVAPVHLDELVKAK